jgi:hypothetical protein
MIEQRRYHIIIEQKVDVFIQVCETYIKKYGIEKKVWVVKDQLNSLVGIGDPDKLTHSKDYGFTIFYEAILDDMNKAVDLFKFKLEHFIKVAKTTDKFQAFKIKNDENKTRQSD